MRSAFPAIACIMVLWAGYGTSAMAQQRFGYINSDKILEKMPEYDGIQQKLNHLANRWQAKLKQMKEHIDSLKAQFEAEKLLYSDKRKTLAKQRIQHSIKQRKEYLQNKFGPNGSYFKKQQQLLKPVQRKLYKAVAKVAKQENIDFVFDRADNTTLFFVREQWNLNKEVLQQLQVSLQK